MIIKYTDSRRSFWRLWGIFILGLLLAGCASESKTTVDPFFEKWKTMAENSMGHSPDQNVNGTGTAELLSGGKGFSPEGGKVAQETPLPTDNTNMKMHHADIKAVLRAMSRISRQNILIKNDIKGDVSVDLKDVAWDQAFNAILHTHGLTYVWEGNVIRVTTAGDMEQDLKISAMKEKRNTQEMETRRVSPLLIAIVNIKYGDAKTIVENLKEFLTKDKAGGPIGSVALDSHTNALIIHAIEEDMSTMLPIIQKVDRPTFQVLIKANIVETTKETARNLGIQWSGAFSARSIGTKFSPSTGSTFPAPVALEGIDSATEGTFALGVINGKNSLDLQLNALQKDGKLNILSSPSITTLDNQKAFTENGEKVPYVSTSIAGGASTQAVQFVDAVLKLEITPHVINGKNLKMQILVKKDEVDPVRKVEGNPYIIKKETQTALFVQDGETIVISGLTKQKNANTTVGVPWLKDIFILGWFFRGQSKQDKMEEVLVFITPYILPPQVVATVR